MGRPKKLDQQDKTDYKRQFNADNYDRLYPYVSKGQKAVYQQAAEKLGMSLNAIIEQALDEAAWKVLYPEEAAKEALERAQADGAHKG